MSIKTVFMTMFLVCVAAVYTNAQTVEVPQEFLDTANQAFKEVKAQREAITALQTALEARKSEAEALKSLVEAKDATIKKLTDLKCNETTIAFKPLGWSIIKKTTRRCYE